MSIPGRNEPCHCGSGKKYKKCCLENETPLVTLASHNKQNAEKWEPEEDELKYLKNKYEEPGSEIIEDEDDDIVYDGLDEINTSREGIINKAYPVISATDEILVDNWWEGLSYEKKPGEIKKYIETIMHSHPHLVENLGLESEVIFELGAEYIKRGEVEEYINFLFYVRKEFFSTYVRNGGYYDLDIIAWLIANKRVEEIENYFDIFIEYPVDFYDKLLEVVALLEATDNISPLIKLVSATFEQVTSSNQLFDGNEILSPLVAKTMSAYIHKDFIDINIADFLNDLEKTIAPLSLDKNDIAKNFWTKTFQNILKPYSKWPVGIPKKKSQIEDRYEDICNNFTRYLYEKTGISWVSAQYYSKQMRRYFREQIRLENGKIRNQFDFTENKIDHIVGRISKNILWVDCITSLSIIQAIYHFAAYLQVCENITEMGKLTIQTDCTTLYHEVYPSLQKESIEAGCFQAFPFF